MSEFSVAIPASLRAWVESRVDSERYRSADDYVRSLIERDQADRRERDVLISALELGERSGLSERQVPAIMADLRMRVGPK